MFDANKTEETKIFAFYLPQFHPCRANDEFWEQGFTDWVTTRSATPLYDGHYQPSVPGELGYYDLTDVDAIRRQARLARASGLSGFAIYHYRFSESERALEKPINIIKENYDIDIDYFISWVNADWTKSWVGDNKTIIRKQRYSKELYTELFNEAGKHFVDDRYYKINGKPVFYIHKPSAFKVEELINLGDEFARSKGFDGITWIAPDHHTEATQKKYFDHLIGYPPGDFPPSKLRLNSYLLRTFRRVFGRLISNSSAFYRFFNVFDYGKYSEKYLTKSKDRCRLDRKYIPTVLSSWDNTPRYGYKGFVLDNSDPDINESVFLETLKSCRYNNKPFFLIKAWNEWAEGNYLEPDLRYGRRRLEALYNARLKDNGGKG